MNNKLLSIFNVADDKTKIARAFNNLTLNYDNFKLRFQYGMWNSDFPATIRKKVFILDYDAYDESLWSKDEIIKFLPIFHDKIEQLFEMSIKQALRDKMNE